jgi:signal transduction histidine kinase
MRARVLSRLMRPTAPPLVLGILLAAALIAVETLVVYPLQHLAPNASLGVVYLVGVLVVSSVWGPALGAATAVFSTAAFDFFHVSPVGSIVFGHPEGQASLVILLAVALLVSFVASVARSRAIEADERRREADLAAEMARVLLRTDDLRSALPDAATRLARALGLPEAAIELEEVAGHPGRAALPLRDGDTVLGTLLVPAELPPATEARIRERVAPSVEAVLRAARERAVMRSALEASRGERGLLVKEQTALRRVATLVARGVPPEEVFAAVSEEVGGLLPVDFADIGRYESDGTVTVVAPWGKAAEHFPVGSRWPIGGKNLCTIVAETGGPARLDDFADASGPIGVASRETGVRSAVATPILVEGRLWGVMTADSTLEQPLPADSETRLASFTELVATAIANAESRARLARLAEQQAALRRVATLVARGVPPEEVFTAVTEEVVRLLEFDSAALARYESGGMISTLAVSGRVRESFPVGRRWALGGDNVNTLVYETGGPARIDSYADATGHLGGALRERGFRSAVGAPIIVEGRLWGAMSAGSGAAQPLPADTEERLVLFTELVATAIANAESRAALTASRARLVAAADETRRRIERDLHDGTQQQLVSLILELRAAEVTEPPEVGELRAQLARTARGLDGVLEELREISRGIHPAILSSGGLERALRVLARRSGVPVELDLRAEQRVPEHVEAAGYYVVSEALTNAAKHAQASVVHVELDASDTVARLAIRDDGIGGADLSHGSGLVGLSDRVEALGGTFQLMSPAGGGTALVVEIPIGDHGGAEPPES